MRTLILGGGGMLGQSLEQQARLRNWPVLALARPELDITVPGSLVPWLERFRPQVVINSAAFTKVDDCEELREEAMSTNGRALAAVVEAVEARAVPLLQVSTDYVFDGEASTPYPESAPTSPRSVYGQSKLLGEEEALRYQETLVVRTSWLFGAHGANFVATMLRLAEQGRKTLQVVHDQVGCPTYVPYLATALLDLAPLGLTGILHYRNREPTSWFDFARTIFRLAESGVEVEPTTTAQFAGMARRTLAPRPAYSVLAVERFEQAVGRPVEAWSDGLCEYLDLIRSVAANPT